jgi:methionine-rich copper-binding protein CopC
MKLRSLLFAATFFALSVTNMPASSAHAVLEKTVPAKGAIVSTNTNKVALFFGEDILVFKGKNPNSISVTSAKGISVGSREYNSIPEHRYRNH